MRLVYGDREPRGTVESFATSAWRWCAVIVGVLAVGGLLDLLGLLN